MKSLHSIILVLKTNLRLRIFECLKFKTCNFRKFQILFQILQCFWTQTFTLSNFQKFKFSISQHFKILNILCCWSKERTPLIVIDLDRNETTPFYRIDRGNPIESDLSWWWWDVYHLHGMIRGFSGARKRVEQLNNATCCIEKENAVWQKIDTLW